MPFVQDETQLAAEARSAGEPGVGHDQAPGRRPSQDHRGVHSYVHPSRLWLLSDAIESQRQLGHDEVRQPYQDFTSQFRRREGLPQDRADCHGNTLASHPKLASCKSPYRVALPCSLFVSFYRKNCWRSTRSPCSPRRPPLRPSPLPLPRAPHGSPSPLSSSLTS